MPPIHEKRTTHDREFHFFATKDGMNLYQAVETFPRCTGNNSNEKVYGVLLTNCADGAVAPIKLTASGSQPELGSRGDARILRSRRWPEVVRSLARILQIRFGAPQDGRGKGITKENLGRYQSTHVEVKLAAHAIVTLLDKNGLKELSLRALMEMRKYEWVGQKRRFEIHVSREPCSSCVSFVSILSSVTGIPITIHIAPCVVPKPLSNIDRVGEGDEAIATGVDLGGLADDLADDERAALEKAYRERRICVMWDNESDQDDEDEGTLNNSSGPIASHYNDAEMSDPRARFDPDTVIESIERDPDSPPIRPISPTRVKELARGTPRNPCMYRKPAVSPLFEAPSPLRRGYSRQRLIHSSPAVLSSAAPPKGGIHASVYFDEGVIDLTGDD